MNPNDLFQKAGSFLNKDYGIKPIPSVPFQSVPQYPIQDINPKVGFTPIPQATPANIGMSPYIAPTPTGNDILSKYKTMGDLPSLPSGAVTINRDSNSLGAVTSPAPIINKITSGVSGPLNNQPQLPQKLTPAALNVGTVNYTQAQLDQQAAETAKNAYYQSEAAPVTEEERRATVMQDFQQQIDALNQIYATNRAEATRLGTGRLGTDTAIQARRGLIGSSFGEAATTGVEQFNVGEMNKVQAEHNAAMNVVQSQLRAALTKSREDKKAAQKLGADYYAEYTKQKPIRDAQMATDQIKAYIAAKANPTDKELEKKVEELKANGIEVNPEEFKKQFRAEKQSADIAAQGVANTQAEVESKLKTEALNRQKTNQDMSKPFEVGNKVYNFDAFGKPQFMYDVKSTSASDTTKGNYSFNPTDETSLYTAGETKDSIALLQNDISTYGPQAVINDAGTPESTRQFLKTKFGL